MWAVSLELFLFRFVSSVQFRLKFITSFLFSSVLIVLEMVTNEPNKHACKLAGRQRFWCTRCRSPRFDGIFACYSHRIFQFSRFTKIGLHGCESIRVNVCECHMITVIKSRNASEPCHAIPYLQNNTHINTFIFSRILPFSNDFYRARCKAK